jgi:hypothetical protein
MGEHSAGDSGTAPQIQKAPPPSRYRIAWAAWFVFNAPVMSFVLWVAAVEAGIAADPRQARVMIELWEIRFIRTIYCASVIAAGVLALMHATLNPEQSAARRWWTGLPMALTVLELVLYLAFNPV